MSPASPADPGVQYHRLMTTFAEMHISPRVFAGVRTWASRSDVVSAAWINAFNSRDRIEGCQRTSGRRTCSASWQTN